MSRNKITILCLVLLSALVLYFGYLIKNLYPTLVNNSILLCDKCLFAVIPTIKRIISVLGVLALGNLILGFFRTSHFRNKLQSVPPPTKQISFLEKKYHLQNRIIIFENSQLMAFCLGIFNPRIYLSTQLLKKMTRFEIEAIVLHEKQHMAGKDNLLLLVLNLIKTAFFFFPIIADVVNSIEIQKEIAADKGVIKETGKTINIVTALRKVLESKPGFVFAQAFSQGFSIEPRIKSLIGKRNELPHLQLNSVLITLGVMLIFINITLSRIEVHSQNSSSTTLCLDKYSCQNSCQ